MPAEDDADEPLSILEDLRPSPSATFFRRLRSSIERRVLGKQLLEVSSLSVSLVALEYLNILMKAVAGREENGGRHE